MKVFDAKSPRLFETIYILKMFDIILQTQTSNERKMQWEKINLRIRIDIMQIRRFAKCSTSNNLEQYRSERGHIEPSVRLCLLL